MRIAVMLVALVLLASTGLCADSYPPGIGSFAASSNPIKAGQSTTLCWYVYGAKNVAIDHGIGNVDFTGTKIVTPTKDTVYRLTATNDAGSISAIAVCNVLAQNPGTITLTNIISEGGQVWSGNWNYGLDVGDTAENSGSQTFLSFDISNIPPGSIIKDAIVDLSGYRIVSGDPFANLGCLRGYSANFGRRITPADYSPHANYSSAALVFCSPSDLSSSQNQLSLAQSIQRELGKSRFQLRLQFPDRESNGDDISDMIELGYVNRLIVTISPEEENMTAVTRIPWMISVPIVLENESLLPPTPPGAGATYLRRGTFVAPPRGGNNSTEIIAALRNRSINGR
jgi:hypothetical protein